MGLHHTAHYLRSKGRGNDTMLVHMTPGEVKGLQALALRHGGSLTINPDTGLPEAGFLEQILPIVAAAGLTYLTAGAAAPALATALGPAAAGGAGLLSAGAATTVGGIAAGALSGAAISGLTAAATGKDAGQAALMGGLGGGIAGGLGAYSGDPSQLAAASQQVATAPTPEVANQLAAQQAQAAQQVTNVSATGLPTPPTPPTPDMSKMTGGIELTSEMVPKNVPVSPGISLAEGQKLAGSTLSPEGGTFYGKLEPYGLGRAAVQSLPAIGLLEDKPQGAGPTDTYQSPLRRLSPNFQAYTPPQPNPYYRERYPTYAAEGGIMQSYQSGGPVERMSAMNTAMNPQGGLYPQGMIDKTQYATPIQRPVSSEMVMEDSAYERSNPMLMASGGIAGFAAGTYLPKGDAGIYRDDNPTTRGQDSFTAALTRLNERQKKANIKGLPGLKAAAKPLGNIEEAAKGGIMSDLGGYSDGGRMLKGPGDGMSDSIPATIGRKQPARLADGEFVVPADVVSHLGNGSTDAGARKLYKMMDKIRAARTGKKKQAPAVKAERYMPA